MKFSRIMIFFALATIAAGCVFDSSKFPNIDPINGSSDNRGKDDDGDSSTDQGFDFDNGGSTDQPAPAPAPAPAPVVDPCPTGVSMDLDVKIHTFLVNGHPNGFAVDGMFEWNASGASGLTVDIQFKTNATDWVAVASGLPAVDVTTVDLSKYAGPSSSWHFRGVARAPGCSTPAAFSSITTIQN